MGSSKFGTKSILKKYFGTKEILKEVVNGSTVYEKVTSSPIYGVSGLYDSNPLLTRTDDAVGMSAIVNSSTGLVSSDFDDVFPWNEATVETINGNKFLHLPDMWFRVGWDSSNRITDVAVSKTQGSTGNWYKVDNFYCSCYRANVDYGTSSTSLIKLTSISNSSVTKNIQRRILREYANNVGSGYSILDLYHHTILYFLWLIEWSTKNSRNIMTGVNNLSSANVYPLNTGGTDSLTTPTGFNISTKQMRWHYIEDFVGNGYECLDGIVGDGTSYTIGNYYVTQNPNNFSDVITGLNLLNYSSPAISPTHSILISAFGWDNNNPFMCMPIELVDSSQELYFCDGYDISNYAVIDNGTPYYMQDRGLAYFGRTDANSPGVGRTARLLYNPKYAN